MTHLGDRVAPLIDGQLPIDASERAMTHMAACPSCQEAADLERLTKQRLASMGAPQPGADFVQRLLALGVTDGPKPPRPGHLPGGSFGSPLTPSRSLPVSMPASIPGSIPGSMPPFGLTTRPPGRKTMLAVSHSPGRTSGATRHLSRTTRSRLAFAAAGAACLVGVGVAGGVAAAPRPGRQAPAPVDSLVIQHSASTVQSPFGRKATFSLAVAGR